MLVDITFSARGTSCFCVNVMKCGLILLSVLGMAYGKDMSSLVYVGLVGIMDPPRDGVRAAIQTLTGMNVGVKMLTGDGQDTAKAVGEYSVFSLLFSIPHFFRY